MIKILHDYAAAMIMLTLLIIITSFIPQIATPAKWSLSLSGICLVGMMIIDYHLALDNRAIAEQERKRDHYRALGKDY